MGTIRSQDQWQNIFKEQENSGSTIVGFCRQHQIPTATFYAYRKKLGVNQSAFIQAKITQQVEVFSSPEPMSLNVGNISLSLPSTTPASYLAQLLRELM
ncbi:IS66 family insertion sequence element accessory protein TnpA [Colwellia hornerae]|uniref:IS66 family insertion sequence element accessory protein TnpB n=1 Tax=Colwellia hornerae TaxID=89402 RepID=A0A5C6Q6D3_9GAMM|nr:IS66 family insertion sequence element accessory protein TnpB [Colwellia hornerae]TWX51605.1 IS66 family insertion sequence element accessory protein TnpB [Colwellia hornerae]TWX57083.1 IS66 family insertion sequence element accessory protein TnpB [Colwellia hornerae]TWX64270.1 IS66 family insertion sequence element accessory protein TnpB [Colwellia hornerae]